MKKTFTLIAICLATYFAKAQNDTLLFENFDVDPTGNYLLFPNGNDNDWVNFDNDNLPDHVGGLLREPNWFWSDGAWATDDTTGCIISNSWFDGPPGAASNYLITPPIQIVDANAVLSWKSAPYQTPLYLDGYVILVSTGGNDVFDYTDTIFAAAEYLAGSSANGGNYSSYTFSNGFVHGEDGTYIEVDTDSARALGILRPFSVSLAAYAGQTIYIAFLHNSFDDNLLAVDDILITGTTPTGISETTKNTTVSVFPNPVVEKLEVSYNLPVLARVQFRVVNAQGTVILTEEKGNQMAGEQHSTLNVKSLASGTYTLQILANNKYKTIQFNKL